MNIVKLYNFGSSEVVDGVHVDITYAYESDVESLKTAGWVETPEDLNNESN